MTSFLIFCLGPEIFEVKDGGWKLYNRASQLGKPLISQLADKIWKIQLVHSFAQDEAVYYYRYQGLDLIKGINHPDCTKQWCYQNPFK